MSCTHSIFNFLPCKKTCVQPITIGILALLHVSFPAYADDTWMPTGPTADDIVASVKTPEEIAETEKQLRIAEEEAEKIRAGF